MGAVGARIWTRDAEYSQRPQQEKRKRRKAAAIEDKESFRWLEDLRLAREVAQELPAVQCIYVADSESDIYHLFAQPRGQHPVEWLIRACHERGVKPDLPASGRRTIREAVLTRPVLFAKQITLRGRRAKIACQTRSRKVSREGRTAQVAAPGGAARVRLRPPANSPLPATQVNVVLVREIEPPPDQEPVEWLLLTTLPIDTAEQVRQIVEYYTVRWMIEVLFRTLKSGCRVEHRRFEHVERLLPCVAVYLIVAWRTLMVVRLGRSCPQMDCESLFEPSEWKSVWMVIHRKPPPRRPPRLADLLRLIGQLGGYVNRPGRADMPGPQTTWLGLQRMRDLAWAWDTFGPGKATKT